MFWLGLDCRQIQVGERKISLHSQNEVRCLSAVLGGRGML